MKERLTAISFALAAAAAVFLVVWTLLQGNGALVIIPITFPVVIALLPLLFRKQAVRIIATIIMWGFAMISGFSIGLFYLPAAIAMLLAACVDDRATRHDAVR
jgi:hypothetical protein